MNTHVQRRVLPRPTIETKLKFRCEIQYTRSKEEALEERDGICTRNSCTLPNVSISYLSAAVPRHFLSRASISEPSSSYRIKVVLLGAIAAPFSSLDNEMDISNFKEQFKEIGNM